MAKNEEKEPRSVREAAKEIVMLPVSEVRPYEKNPRKNQKAVKFVKASIEKFGFKQPIIVDSNRVVVCGHTRLLAAKSLGMAEVPCIFADDLTDAQIKAYRLADNKVAEFSEWEMNLLGGELGEIAEISDIDMGDFGFDLSEFDNIGMDEKTEVEEDEVPEEVEPVCKRGDIWQLGEHRLMCGDSTNPDDVKKLLGCVTPDMTFTDPPYNIAYSGVNDKRTIKNDKMSDDDFVEFLRKSIMTLDTVYVCCSWQYAHLFKKAMELNGIAPKAMIVWNKVHAAQHLDKYYKQHELIWYYGKFGGQKTLRGDIWEVPREPNTVHPTMKPLKLIALALSDQPDKKVVYDGFGGSGSTLATCEQLGRVCYTMELDPHYCNVIIARWEKLTGQKAQKI